MNDDQTNEILRQIQQQNSSSFQSLVEQVSKLTDSVQKLVVIDSAREEREKNQDGINKKQHEYNKRHAEKIDKILPTVDWVLDFKSFIDKIKIPVFVALIFGLLKLVGFDWGK